MVKSVNKFKKGDLVQLKSGGPIMTIDDISYSYPTVDFVISPIDLAKKRHKEDPIGVDYYSCVWFNGKKVESKNFSEDSLKVPG